MLKISQLCERTAALQMIECTRFGGCFSVPSSSCVHVLQDPCAPLSQSLDRGNVEREGGGESGRDREESTEDTVPTREAHCASVPSLQLRALIRLIVSNIETHNKHNTWQPFAILISPSQLAWTTQLQPSGISLI